MQASATAKTGGESICILRLRHPRRHITLERSSAKESLHLGQDIKQLYGSPVLDDSNSAIRLYRASACLLMPPVVEKKAGTNDECSISRMRFS